MPVSVTAQVSKNACHWRGTEDVFEQKRAVSYQQKPRMGNSEAERGNSKKTK